MFLKKIIMFQKFVQENIIHSFKEDKKMDLLSHIVLLVYHGNLRQAQSVGAVVGDVTTRRSIFFDILFRYACRLVNGPASLREFFSERS